MIIESPGARRVTGQIIVSVVGEVDGGGLVCVGLHGHQQNVVLGQFVPDGGDHIPWETFIAVFR